MTESLNYRRVEAAIKYLAAHRTRQPSLEATAAHVHLSPFHFQRLFTQWAGISPKKFLQFLTVEELKKEVMTARNLMQAAEAVGLSTQSRVYDLFVTFEAVTPQEYRTRGKDLSIEYGVHSSPFGNCFVANTPRGICALEFVDDGGEEEAIGRLAGAWREARISRNEEATQSLVPAIFGGPDPRRKFRLLLRGTRFQIKVWQALLRIPFGRLASYQAIAASVREPGAARAVSSAISRNPVAFLIPCHRVIRKEGLVGGYHWGPARKCAMIGWEKGRAAGQTGLLSSTLREPAAMEGSAV